MAIGINASKSRLFTVEERLAMIERATAHLDNVRVGGFTGLLTAFCVEQEATAIVKGLRSGADFDYELQMAQMNAGLAPDVETVFVATSPAHGFVSSTLVKEVASYGGDVTAHVPAFVAEALVERLTGRAGDPA